MVSYVQIIQRLPQEWQMTMVELVEAVERQLREQLAVRREDIVALSADVRELAQAQKRTEAQVGALAEAQARTEERVSRLEEAIARLTEAQARTEAEFREFRAQSEERFARIEAALERLTEAQARTEKRVEELAHAQARTEERVTRLEVAVEKLAQAQARTEERVARLEVAVEKLAQAQARTEKALAELSRHVGYLSNVLGADLEVDAEEVLRYAMQQKGYRLLGPARPVEIDGEIDVALPVEDPAGQRLWAVVEAKARVREKEVERWGHRFKNARFLQRLNRAGIPGPYLPYVFGLRIYPDVLPTAEKAGVGILDFRGEQVEAAVIA